MCMDYNKCELYQYKESNIKITIMKMMFHIDDFKCTLCANWFCPPFNLPYLLPCTHSICTSCLQKASNNDHIICPQDLQACPIQSININLTTKKALQRLMKQHKNYNQNTQLQCIKSLSIGFDQVLMSKQKQLRNLQGLIDQIFMSQIQRLKHIHEKLKTQINRPYRVVQDWKQVVASHLTSVRKAHHQNSTAEFRSNSMLQLNHYIEEGRKIKMELNQFFQLEFDIFADKVMRNPRVCFDKDFNINSQTLQKKLKAKPTYESATKYGTEQKKDKRNIISEAKTKIQSNQNQQIEGSTIVISNESKTKLNAMNQNRLSMNTNRSIKNMQNMNMNMKQQISMNMNTNMNMNANANMKQDLGIETKRGHNKQKSNFRSSRNAKQNGLDAFITKEDDKKHNRGQSKHSNDSRVKKNMLGSPQRVQKNNKNKKNGDQWRVSMKSGINPLNQPSIQSRHEQFSLSQFQLQTLNMQGDSRIKQKSRALRQITPNLNLITNQSISQYKECSPTQKLNTSQNQRFNRLAHMLDNVSSNASLVQSGRNSLRKSKKNIDRRNNVCHQSSMENGSLLMSPNTICEQYTEEGEEATPYQEEQLLNNDEGVKQETDNGWKMGNVNFLREWQLKNQTSADAPLQVRQNHYYYNCQKQKLSYLRKMQIHRVQQALKQTLIKDNYIQLINQSLHDVDMTLYLSQFNWHNSNIEIVKFVKTSLTDQQLNILLNFLMNSHVKALVLSGNNLTDICLDALLNFVTVNCTLKNVYLPKNCVNIMKSKGKINLLKEKGVNIYI